MATRLRSISTTAGFLENCTFEFSPHLTCIIGARGTCKSTLIESIRFAFETDSARIATLVGGQNGDNRAPTFGIIQETLGAGSVRCNVSGSENVAYSLEREVGDETRIFVDGVREHADSSVLQEIEVFSQGDLQRIAEDKNNDLRLALIDRPHKTKVAKLKARRRAMSDELVSLGPKLRNVRSQISTLQHELAQLDLRRAELKKVSNCSPEASPELEIERNRYEERQVVMENIRFAEQDRAELVARLSDSRLIANRLAMTLESIESTESTAANPGGAMFHALGLRIQEFKDVLNKLEKVELQSTIDALHRKFEDESEKYYRLRQAEQEVNESLKLQQALKRQVKYLEKQSDEASQAKGNEADLLRRRRSLREALGEVDDELYELRAAEIDAINQDHGDTVQLSVASSWTSPEYARNVGDLLAGSRIRTQEEVAESIAALVEPHELIDLVEQGDAQRLAQWLDRDLGQMTRVVAHLADHEELYELESVEPMARLEIILFDNGQPKAVETLSKGQRATALLPIILRPLPYPLLFDQPEDDLDNKFIFQYLISTILDIKTQRQLIFVTHNANIPVLGEAERVVVMKMENPKRAGSPVVGTVDQRKKDILELLEGGAEAFASREKYYHDILSLGDDETTRHT